MRRKTFSQINRFSLEFREPEKASLAMRDFVNKVILHAKASATTNLVNKFIKFGLSFNDVEAHAN